MSVLLSDNRNKNPALTQHITRMEGNTLTVFEPLIRMAVFLGMFVGMAMLEAFVPRRPLRFDRLVRWPANLIITFMNTLAARIVVPIGAVGFAAAMESRGIGLLNMLGLQGPVVVGLSIVFLDLAIWFQHVVFHRVPALWRVHRMHHSDNDIDVTTGARFHPFEIVLSLLIKISVIGACGIPAAAVLLFEVILNGCAMFNHANVRLPAGLDNMLRQLVVTPDMHRVHHSTASNEINSNFGFCLSIWDRLFGTYVAQPGAGHDGMTIGLPETQDMFSQRIDVMLVDPVKQLQDPD